MRCLQSLLLIVAIGLTGCSGVVFFSAGFHPINTLVTVSGIVSVIQITTITSAGATTTLVTIVTFLQAGTQFLWEYRESVRPQCIHYRGFQPRAALRHNCGNIDWMRHCRTRVPALRCSDVAFWIAFKLFLAGV